MLTTFQVDHQSFLLSSERIRKTSKISKMARFFLALFALVLLAAVANASIEDNTVEVTPEEEEEYRRGVKLHS